MDKNEVSDKTPINYFYGLFPSTSLDVIDYIVSLDLVNSFNVGHSIFDYSEKNNSYLLNNSDFQDEILRTLTNHYSHFKGQLLIDLDNFININAENAIYAAYHIQYLIQTLKELDDFQVVSFDEISLDDEDISSFYEMIPVFEACPVFCSKVFRTINRYITILTQELSQKYSVHLTRVITKEDIEYNEQLNIIEKAKVAERIVFLNELGIIESIRTKYPDISDTKLAAIIRKICLPEYSIDTIKRPINSIESPPTPMSTKNNPYNSNKNLEEFNTFIAKLNLKES
jgi:hypothetical protein